MCDGEGEDDPQGAPAPTAPVGPNPEVAAEVARIRATQSRYADALREHLALVLSVAVSAAFLIKVYAVSNGNIETAAILLRHSGPTEVLLGLALVAVPASGGILIGDAVGQINNWGDVKRSVADLPVTKTVLVLLFAVFLLPGPTAAVLVGWYVWGIVRYRRLRSKPARPAPWDELVKSPHAPMIRAVLVPLVQIMFVAVFLLPPLFSRTVWLPTERFKVADKAHVVVGYSVARDEKDLLILRDDDRKIVRVPATTIENRAYCENAELRQPQSLVFWLVRRDSGSYPDCKD